MAKSNTNPYDSVVQLALQVYRNIGTSTSDQDSDAQISMTCNLIYAPPSKWPPGSFDSLEEFILDSLGYCRINVVSQPHHAFRTVVQMYAKYRRGDLRITLMEANTDHIFDIITSSLTMGDIFMTPGGVAAFYPDLTFKKILVLNSTLNEHPPGTKHVGCMKHAHYKVYNSTQFLQEPCSHICPALWCNIVDGGPGGLVLEWDSSYLHYLYLLIKGLCESRKHVCTTTTVMRSYTGILYATRAHAPELVPILLRDGLKRLKHINDLEVLHGVDCLGKTNPSLTWHVYGYTFFREHPSLFAPPNALIEDITADGRFGNAVMGNVLVIKHINGKKHQIVDLTIADLDCINKILRRIKRPSSNGDIIWHGSIGGVALELLNGRHNNQGRVYSDSNGLEDFDEFVSEVTGQAQTSKPHEQSGGGSSICNASWGFRKSGERLRRPINTSEVVHCVYVEVQAVPISPEPLSLSNLASCNFVASEERCSANPTLSAYTALMFLSFAISPLRKQGRVSLDGVLENISIGTYTQ
ncbi:hypothetical protein F4604DRAFT_1674178 [Suillus subluteus]|nr:hypothetical protein F4604DRAFT_1694293 [Suillus subluteus]KAG1840129.1 hypothetical protein F4604DRAFT_1690871 [Suillus subluteus]KAG1888491.1 hypothetical protein F4604DRAFT_1674178 [Suillus subluteus]